MTGVPVVKAHAFGNDFLLVSSADATGHLPDLAQSLCNRHTGVGGDGLIVFAFADRGARMKLINADGSPSELSGNGLRCLAALVAERQHLASGDTVSVVTDAGPKTLELLDKQGGRYSFRAAMGQPAGVTQARIEVLGEEVVASVLSMGNPQCVVLGPLPDQGRFQRFGPALSTHPMFPAGTNVEFAEIESSARVRILIWERGVGPTTSSGTGASAAAVAAATHGGAARALDVVAPGGVQHVDWRDDGVYLTGWAEIVLEGTARLS